MTTLTVARLASRFATPRKGLFRYIDLYRQRRALASMDKAQLMDLGLTREEAEIEAARPIWDAPQHWFR